MPAGPATRRRLRGSAPAARLPRFPAVEAVACQRHLEDLFGWRGIEGELYRREKPRLSEMTGFCGRLRKRKTCFCSVSSMIGALRVRCHRGRAEGPRLPGLRGRCRRDVQGQLGPAVRVLRRVCCQREIRGLACRIVTGFGDHLLRRARLLVPAEELRKIAPEASVMQATKSSTVAVRRHGAQSRGPWPCERRPRR